MGYVTGLLGLAFAIALVVHDGWHAVYAAIDRAGWVLLWLLPFHFLPLALDVFGWRVLLSPRDPRRRAAIPVLFWIATVREAVNRLLPVASIGGEVVGVRLLKWRGIDGAAATASVIIEVLVTIVGQYLFTALGLVLLIGSTAHTGVLGMALAALALSLPVPVVLVVLVRHGGMFARLQALGRRWLTGRAARVAELMNGHQLDREIRVLYARHVRVFAAGGWQFGGFVVGSFESWLILRMLGHPIGVVDTIALEAVTQTLRQMIFIVPAGLGVQEGSLVLMGSIIGLPADLSVALALVKRMREVVFGVPALVSWQWAEMHRLRRQRCVDARPGSSNPDTSGMESRCREATDVQRPRNP
ncbi:MAG: flippase-like domain-containing protein [Rhodanobacteraceae bacterium]|nr:MAG: flippase-like domain-containing protein [Rhodanobacteraceae bacterium]